MIWMRWHAGAKDYSDIQREFLLDFMSRGGPSTMYMGAAGRATNTTIYIRLPDASASSAYPDFELINERDVPAKLVDLVKPDA